MFEFALPTTPSKTQQNNPKTIQIKWIDLFLLSILFYAFLNNHISVDFHLLEDTQNGSAHFIPSTEASAMPQALAVKNQISPLPSTPKKVASPSAIAPPKKKSTEALPANNFSNISAILVKNFSKKYPISESEVQARKANCYAYVDRFAPVAIAEMKKYGIPASITLAQGLLESDAGGSRLSRINNNHFGMKCFSKKCKKGHCSNFSDDTHKDFFRKYNNAWESFRAHSQLLQAKRYAHLKKLGTKNYKDWAHGLKKAGYATDKRYAHKLIQLIEIMQLDQYDL